jgi:hypothetical protein
MAISIECSSCGGKFRAPDRAAGQSTKCPKCGNALRIPGATQNKLEVSTKTTAEPTQCNKVAAAADLADQQSARSDALANHSTGFQHDQVAPTPPVLDRPMPGGVTVAITSTPDHLDGQTKFALLTGGIGLVALAVSPSFKWATVVSGGVIGLHGEAGKIVLSISLFAMAVYIAVLIKQRLLLIGVLAAQAWGTVAVFWMAGVIWTLASISDRLDADNMIGQMLATQIAPGSGLYLGLIGGIVVAASLGFVALRRPIKIWRVGVYHITQVVSLAVGVWIAVFIAPDRASNYTRNEEKTREFPSLSREEIAAIQARAQARLKAQVTWKEANKVTDAHWEKMIANYKARKQPKLESEIDWWEEAKDKTPAELDKLYPPLKLRDLYRAEWVPAGLFSKSRELDNSFGEGDAVLKIEVRISTPPNVPIKELYGKMSFIKDNHVIYETQIADKPKVSFTDYDFVFLRIPYDDSNANHRTLRFAKDEELTPVFTVSKVVLADGSEQELDRLASSE